MQRIVLIDDSQEIQKLYHKALTAAGFEVLQYFNGDVSVHEISKQKPNLILLDVMLPGDKNGFDILEEIMKNDQTKNIPVFMMTTLEGEDEAAKRIGAKEYIIKSKISVEDLIEKIKKTI